MKQPTHLFGFALPGTSRSRARIFATMRGALCVAALLSPALLHAQQTNGGDELGELRKQLQAIADRIDALEKQRSDAAGDHTQHGGPSANLATTTAGVSLVAPQPAIAQEATPAPNAKPAKA